jgi:hypothetical protein
MKRFWLGICLLGMVFSMGACRTVVYSTYEKFGVYKRDLLRKRVTAARDEQKGAQQEFKDALTRLKELTGFSGGELEKGYRQLQSDYDAAARRVASVHKRIQDVQTVADDLFREWEKENAAIGTDTLRQTSRQQLNETRARYEALVVVLKRVEQGMDPVLRKLHDYVLALKHSLNAQAIASLQGESAKIQSEIGVLIKDMNASIAQADVFIQQVPK